MAVLVVSVVSLGVDFPREYPFKPEGTFKNKEMTPEEIQANISEGMSLEQVKAFLDARQIDYGMETKEEMGYLSRENLPEGFAFKIVFVIPGEAPWYAIFEKSILIKVLFDTNNSVMELRMEDVWHGL